MFNKPLRYVGTPRLYPNKERCCGQTPSSIVLLCEYKKTYIFCSSQQSEFLQCKIHTSPAYKAASLSTQKASILTPGQTTMHLTLLLTTAFAVQGLAQSCNTRDDCPDDMVCARKFSFLPWLAKLGLTAHINLQN
jgi:hypothetical protein